MKKIAFHPLLLCLYPMLFLYSTNMDKTTFGTAVWPMLISMAGTIVFTSLGFVFFKNVNKSAILTAFIILLFFSYGHLHSWIYGFFLLEEGGKSQEISTEINYKQIIFWSLTSLWIILAVIVFFLIRKIKNSALSKITFVLNGMSIVLFAMPLFTIVLNTVSGYSNSNNQTSKERLSPIEESEVIKKIGYKPDIYIFVLDGYGRYDVLKKNFNFDNKAFINFLKGKGFFVAKNSYANYFWTDLSLSSSMNMMYINYLADVVGRTSNDRSELYELIRNNKLARYLKEQGYKIVHLDSTYGPTMKNPYADIEFTHGKGLFHIEFYRVLMETSMLKLWESSVEKDLARLHLKNLKTLETIATMDGPKMVFSHFVPPHHPYLFDSEGNTLKHVTVSNQFDFQSHLWSKRKKYVDQIKFLNKRFTKIVNLILKESENPPIIVIHSDHGPHVLLRISGRKKVQGRFGNLMAIYTPGVEGLFNDNITPVNMFATILNHYFGDDLPILDPEHYISGFKTPYSFKKSLTWLKEKGSEKTTLKKSILQNKNPKKLHSEP